MIEPGADLEFVAGERASQKIVWRESPRVAMRQQPAVGTLAELPSEPPSAAAAPASPAEEGVSWFRLGLSAALVSVILLAWIRQRLNGG